MAGPASCAMGRCSSRPGSGSPMWPARACRRLLRRTVRSWPVRHGARPASRWSSIPPIPTCRPRTPTCATSAPSAMAWQWPRGSGVASTSPRSTRSTKTCGTGIRSRTTCARPSAKSAMRRTSAGAMNISSCATATRRAVWADCSSTTCMATSSAILRICVRSAMVSWTPICRWSSAAKTRRMASANANSSCTGAAAMSSSTWSMTAAPCSGCRAVGAAKAS
ncbi:hypothetical protein D3C71_1169210 [compost metagenome]